MSQSDPSLELLLEQEQRLQFDRFNADTAWQLGVTLKELAEQRQAQVALNIYAFGQVLFSYAMAGTAIDNQQWIVRKRTSVLEYGHSSYYLGCYNRSKNRVFEDLPQVDPMKNCAHGGSFPLRIRDCGIIGAVTASGLPQHLDHQLVVDALSALIK